jgi:hypothetical protein
MASGGYYSLASPGFRYAVSHDGKRFLLIGLAQAEEPDSAPITVVVNWTAELKK